MKKIMLLRNSLNHQQELVVSQKLSEMMVQFFISADRKKIVLTDVDNDHLRLISCMLQEIGGELL